MSRRIPTTGAVSMSALRLIDSSSDNDDSGSVSLSTVAANTIVPRISPPYSFSSFRDYPYRGPLHEAVIGFDMQFSTMTKTTTTTITNPFACAGMTCTSTTPAVYSDTSGTYMYTDNTEFRASTSGGSSSWWPSGWPINTEHTIVARIKPEVNTNGHFVMECGSYLPEPTPQAHLTRGVEIMYFSSHGGVVCITFSCSNEP